MAVELSKLTAFAALGQSSSPCPLNEGFLPNTYFPFSDTTGLLPSQWPQWGWWAHVHTAQDVQNHPPNSTVSQDLLQQTYQWGGSDTARIRGKWMYSVAHQYTCIQCIGFESIHCTLSLFNPLRPSDALWQHRSRSPSHYLNQYWPIISKVKWHSSEGIFIRDTSAIIHES